jgi:hypothetical protein
MDVQRRIFFNFRNNLGTDMFRSYDIIFLYDYDVALCRTLENTSAVIAFYPNFYDFHVSLFVKRLVHVLAFSFA